MGQIHDKEKKLKERGGCMLSIDVSSSEHGALISFTNPKKSIYFGMHIKCMSSPLNIIAVTNARKCTIFFLFCFFWAFVDVFGSKKKYKHPPADNDPPPFLQM